MPGLSAEAPLHVVADWLDERGDLRAFVLRQLLAGNLRLQKTTTRGGVEPLYREFRLVTPTRSQECHKISIGGAKIDMQIYHTPDEADVRCAWKYLVSLFFN